MAFSSDGRTLASLGHGESVKLWNVPALREVVSQSEPKAAPKLLFSPDDQKLAVETDKDKLSVMDAPPV